jgi:hypothetical protein
MTISREPIYSSLFALLQSIEGVTTVSRRLRHWSDVSPAEQPALFQIQKNEMPEQVLYLPTKWRLNVDLYLYVNSGDDPQASPAIILNPILDAIEALFPPSDEDGPMQTLGGLVSHCWISGTIETTEGVLGQQEVAIIPIEILTT